MSSVAPTSRLAVTPCRSFRVAEGPGQFTPRFLRGAVGEPSTINRKGSRQSLIVGWIAVGVVASALALRQLLPPRLPDSTGPAAIFESAYAILLAISLALLALALGDLLLALLRLRSSPALERFGFSLGLGLGLIGYAMLLLGLLGMLRPTWIGAGILLGLALLHRRVGAWLGHASQAVRAVPAYWSRLSPAWKMMTAIMIWIGVLTVLIALTPPSAYDALMYHLLGPRLFLEQGSVFPSTTRWWINFPFVAEMGYTATLALQSDSAARLLHLLWATAFLAATFGLARRWADALTARWAIAIVLGMPLLAILSADADTDFVWSTLELLSLAALLIGVNTEHRGWVLLAGIFAGMALGAKYLSFLGVGTLAVLLLWLRARQGLRAAVVWLGIFTVTAGLVGLPWYLKNWIWLGDPLFPYFRGGWLLDPARMSVAAQLSRGFSRPSGLVAWITLPLSMYLAPWKFGSNFPPSLLLLGAVVLPFVPRSRYLNAMGLLSLSWFVLWSLGPALIARYLIPAVPLAAILSAYSAMRVPLSRRAERYGRILTFALAATSLAATALMLAGIAAKDGVLGVVSGTRSRESYLKSVIPTYPALAYAESHLAEGSVLLSTGDGRAYYCEDRCLDSDDQTLWLSLALQAQSTADFAGSLHQRGVSHLLYTPGDIAFFRDFMPGDSVERATSFLLGEFLPTCAHAVFSDANTTLYEIDC